VGVGDFNNDGLEDLFFGGNQVSSRLYLNEGKLKFKDVTNASRVATDRWVTGVSVIDINQDGLLDVFLAVAGRAGVDSTRDLPFINTGIKDGVPVFVESALCACDQLVRPAELYIVIEEADLVEIIKKAAAKNLKLGKSLGIIAYNDSPFKEILAGGISVLSTDFQQMGRTMAEMVRSYSRDKIKNPFHLIMRRSV